MKYVQFALAFAVLLGPLISEVNAGEQIEACGYAQGFAKESFEGEVIALAKTRAEKRVPYERSVRVSSWKISVIPSMFGRPPAAYACALFEPRDVTAKVDAHELSSPPALSVPYPEPDGTSKFAKLRSAPICRLIGFRDQCSRSERRIETKYGEWSLCCRK